MLRVYRLLQIGLVGNATLEILERRQNPQRSRLPITSNRISWKRPMLVSGLRGKAGCLPITSNRISWKLVDGMSYLTELLS